MMTEESENCSHTPTQQHPWRKLSPATPLKHRHFKPLWSSSNNSSTKNPNQTKLLTEAVTTRKDAS
uniref:Alternative protein PAX6 n=1 Tax=Homo sapiens TaxID=9606 RepID=L8E7A6_HUMAN|nr:alternative protein PAX6 [Homo sapiens]